MATTPVFAMTGIRKAFGPNAVLRGVALELRPGEVTVLMGANGAGKSTLVKIMSGVHRADAGEMRLAGARFAPAGPAAAMEAGVVTVHQSIDDGVVGALDVATNLVLDRLAARGRGLWFSRRAVRREAEGIAAQLGLDVDLRAEVAELSPADRQMVAIARAMARAPRVLILDEPTSTLSRSEAERLFGVIDRLRAQGVAILYISHRMSDIRRLADRIVSLRDGAIAGVFEGAALDYEGAVNAMLGMRLDAGRVAERSATGTVFSAEDLQIAAGARPFSLAAGTGEVVAVTGLVGVGKTRLAETIFGRHRPLAGRMTLDGAAHAPASPAQAIRAGVFLVAKDRAQTGIVPGFDLAENISLPFLQRFSSVGLVRRGAERTAAEDQIAALRIVCQSPRDDPATLSGGNQQKVIVGRWLSQPMRLLMLDEPFQGVDIGARRDIAANLRAQAGGRATLLFLTEVDEALEVADRILVMSEHTLVGEHRNAEFDIDALLADVAGAAEAQGREDMAPHGR